MFRKKEIKLEFCTFLGGNQRFTFITIHITVQVIREFSFMQIFLVVCQGIAISYALFAFA